MGLGIPPLKNNIMLESNPLKPTMLVGRLGVTYNGGVDRGRQKLVVGLVVIGLLVLFILTMCVCVYIYIYI